MLRALATLLLVGALAGCSALLPRPDDSLLDDTAEALVDDVGPVGLIVATAALYHARTGAFPLDRFALLGSPVAAETGLRAEHFASFTLAPVPEGLEVAFVSLPTRANPGDRGGSLTLRLDGDAYTAPFRLYHVEDPDFGETVLPIETQGPVRVMRAGGTIRVNPDMLERTLASGRRLVPPFTDSGLGIAFRRLPAGPDYGRFVVAD